MSLIVAAALCVTNMIAQSVDKRLQDADRVLGLSRFVNYPQSATVGDEPVLLYCLKTGGGGGGPAIHRYRFEIQQVMDELCPGYKLESFDFSKMENMQ